MSSSETLHVVLIQREYPPRDDRQQGASERRAHEHDVGSEAAQARMRDEQVPGEDAGRKAGECRQEKTEPSAAGKEQDWSVERCFFDAGRRVSGVHNLSRSPFRHMALSSDRIEGLAERW